VGLAAAVFGLIDWLAIPSGTRAKAVGMWHGATNVVMVLAKQLKESVYQDPGVAVTGSSRTRTSGTTRDGALILKKDPQVGRGRDPRRTIPLTKAQGWVEAANFRDPEIDLQTLASVQRTHRGSTTDPRQWSR